MRYRFPSRSPGAAMLASSADTLMTEAYEGGGATVAFATVAGFLTSYLLSAV